MTTTEAKPKKYKQNWFMTTGCRHDWRGMCDFCLVAYGNHIEAPKGKTITGHKFSKKDGGEKFVCASCVDPKKAAGK